MIPLPAATPWGREAPRSSGPSISATRRVQHGEDNAGIGESLNQQYHVEVDRVDASAWTDTISAFDDASLYQTWAYGAVRWGENNLSHLILKRGTDLFAAAQLRIVRLPVLRAGIAFASWGPMWRPRRAGAHLNAFRGVVRALKDEYVDRRGLLLRLAPYEMGSERAAVQSILHEEAFHRQPWAPVYNTIRIDLTRTVEDLRKGLRAKWRRDLARSEKNPFQIQQSDGLDLYDQFLDLYADLTARKRFVQHVDVNEFRDVQRLLPPAHKMRIMICTLEGRPVSAVIVSTIGRVALLLFAATNAEGRKTGAAYYIKWRELLWLKEQGYESYDFGGVDPIRNPQVYRAKAGVLGDRSQNGEEVSLPGQWDAYQGALNPRLIRSADFLRAAHKAFRERMTRLKSGIHLQGGNPAPDTAD